MDTPILTSAQSNENLQYGLTAGAVIDFIDTLNIKASDNLDSSNFATINVSLAQVAMRNYNSLPDYLREMNMLAEQASNQRAHILCFPAFTGLLPASLFKQYKRIIGEFRLDPVDNKPSDMWIYQAAVGLASECFEVYFATMSALAAAHGIFIAAGSTIYKENTDFVHRALIFGPNGKLIGYQDKLSPTIIEHSLQIETSSKLNVFDTSIGKLAIIINEDIDYFEIARIAANKGAQMIINPSAHLVPYNNSYIAEGLNLRVQENPVYGLKPTLIGTTDMGIELAGTTGFFAPSRFAPETAKNCRIVSAIKEDQTQLITTQLSLDSLDKVEQMKNPDFVRKYVDYIY